MRACDPPHVVQHPPVPPAQSGAPAGCPVTPTDRWVPTIGRVQTASGATAAHTALHATRARVADALGCDLADVADLAPVDAAALGDRHQAALAAAGTRHRTGSWYTPPEVVDALLCRVLDPLLAERERSGAAAVAAIRVVDPACGAGAVLTAAADRIAGALVRCGAMPAEAARQAAGGCVVGLDVDPVAVDLARLALHAAGAPWRQAVGQVRAADALGGVQWAAVAGGPVDVVAGNPPFRSGLARRGALTPGEARRVRSELGVAAGAYTDLAALFLLAAVQQVRPDGGVVGLLQPRSVLAVRHAEPVRQAVDVLADLLEVWEVPDGAFGAAVAVCAPVLRRRDARSDPVAPPAAGPVSTAPATTWSVHLVRSRGVPALPRLPDAGAVTQVATATADFRDEYYGLRGALVDRCGPGAGCPPLVTVGAIDPLRNRWGERPARVHHTRFDHPRVELARLDDAMRRWAAARSVPKVLLATQTSVLECVVDPLGALLPSVPVVSVVPAPQSSDAVAHAGQDAAVGLWHLAAVLTGPVATLVALHRHAGGGLGGDTLRLAARDVLALPLPADRRAWDEAAAAVAQLSGAHPEPDAVAALGDVLAAPYGLPADHAVTTWWRERLTAPRRRRGGRPPTDAGPDAGPGIRP